ncbi:hypothetical protein SY27_05085 [Flavobacterium sp. 316]|uniref:hypothetical protein n=1 Tax=Flavobacterium sp. 316 TaxID=1603293 RepID=UPI0005E5C302|nr:hypothetical protein [Flavobacterium sp. 316]KIX22045.1 hypothetical protein SY27_05085 [Flavobacterium sp. 316]
MTISKSILISKKYVTRGAKISLGYIEVPNTSFLSELSTNSIDKIINDLNWILSQPTGVITWGVDRCMVDSDFEGSLCTDYDGIEVGDIPTNLMKDLMEEIKSFKHEYEDLTNLRSLITQAFSDIKLNPNNYKMLSNSEYYYSIVKNDIYITLILTQEDLNLSSVQYVNQISLDI